MKNRQGIQRQGKIPTNLFCLVSFSRVIAQQVLPIYILKIGLIPCLMDSLLHMLIAKFTHQIYIYYAEKFNEKEIFEIVKIILGRKWREVLGILGTLNFNGLIMTYTSQLQYHIQQIAKFIDDNQYFIYIMYVVVFLMLITSCIIDLEIFIKLQWFNLIVQILILSSIIAMAIESPNNNVFHHLFITPTWFDYPSLFSTNNLSYHNLIYSVSFLILDTQSSQILNKQILQIANYTNFFNYFIFGICGFIALDPTKMQNFKNGTIVFDFYTGQSVASLVLHILFIYISLWGIGFYFNNLKVYLQSFLIDHSKYNQIDQNLIKFNRVFHLIYFILLLIFYCTTKFQLQPYQLVIANISYLFLIVLPYYLTYYSKEFDDNVIDFRPQSQLEQYNSFQEQNDQHHNNQVDSYLQVDLLDDFSDFEDRLQKKKAGNNQQYCDSSYVNISDSENSQQINQETSNTNLSKKKIIQEKTIKERKNQVKFWMFGTTIFIGYIMSGLEFTHFFYEVIFDEN